MIPIGLFHLHYSQSVQSGYKLSNEAQPKLHSSYTHTQELRKFDRKVVERKVCELQVFSSRFCDFVRPLPWACQTNMVRNSGKYAQTKMPKIRCNMSTKGSINPTCFPTVLLQQHYSQSVQWGCELINGTQPKPHSSYTHVHVHTHIHTRPPQIW